MESPAPTATTLGEEALAGFRERFGREPDGVWSAPGRVNLIGEHTDYNEGFVLPVAIDQRTWVAVGRTEDRVVRLVSTSSSASGETVIEHGLDDITPESVDGWSAYPLGTAWGVLQGAEGADLSAVGGFDAYFTSDVPLGAGLSSSAAIECALATALVDLWALDLSDDELLRATVQAENVIVGAPTGILDQSASLFSRAGHALFIDCRDSSREPIPFLATEAGLSLVVIDTRVKHAHAEGGYGDRRAACEEAARILGVPALRDVTAEALEAGRDRLDEVTYRRARHIVTEDERVQQTVALLRSEGPRSIGDLLLASHASMRDDFEISVPELDTAVEAAVSAGAIGARMTGGGFGGSAIALVDTDRVEMLTDAVRAAFAEADFKEPAIFVVAASDGARRESD
ncbi:galactokinase [Nocardioides sp. Iso805N]|uniref:galactokinase n=1 Tax=Nocardioides sp. Iso805N TaxID=1283287 RepID=UPI00037694AB|nr:galactokinase [Nocardioides sp. Iso805N]